MAPTRSEIVYDIHHAAHYARFRDVRAERLEPLLEHSRIGPGSRVLEVGCGTGNYILAIADITGAQCAGIDISEPMLAHARMRGGSVAFAWGTADCLDFDDASFDLVYSVDVIHHLGAVVPYAREAYRVLKPGGRLCTITQSHDMIRRRPILARYFPDTVAADIARYPAAGDICRAMEDAGFTDLAEIAVTTEIEVGEGASFKYKAYSALHLISEHAFQSGLAQLERDLASGPIHGQRRTLLIWGTL